MMNPSQRRRNALGGVQVGKLRSTDPLGPEALAHEVRRTAIRDMPETSEGRMFGVPAIEMTGRTAPMYISNDDIGERRGAMPINYRFGVPQGEVVGNDGGKVYPSVYNDAPVKRNGQSVPIGVNEILDSVEQSGIGMPALAPEAKWMEGAQLRDQVQQQQLAQGYGGEGWSRYGGDFGPSPDLVTALMAQNPTGVYAQMRQANGGAKNQMLNPANASLAPSRLFQPNLPSVDVTPQLFGETPQRQYSESEPLQVNAYGALVRPAAMPSAFQASVAPVGGMDFQTMQPTSIQPGYSRINMPSAVYQDKGTSPYAFDSGIKLTDGREVDIGFNGFNDHGNTRNNPFGESPMPAGFVDETYQKYGRAGELTMSDNQMLKERDRILGKADHLMALEQQMGSRPTNLLQAVDRGYTVNRQDGIDRSVYDMVDNPSNSRGLPPDLFNLVPRAGRYQETGTSPFDVAERLHGAARQADMGFQSNLSTESDLRGVRPDDIQRELILREMAQQKPDLALFTRAMADQDQSMATVSRKGDLRQMAAQQGPAMTGFDERLVGSFKQQQEMARRAMYGQFALDETQKRAMPLPDIEPVQVSMMDAAGNLTQTVQDMDYRDVLSQRRDLGNQGYGQLQQRIPVAYDDNGDRYPVMNVGHENMSVYPYTNKGKADLARGEAFTQNNQFHSIGPSGERIFHGVQSLPLTLGVTPSRADNFTADEAIRIQPAYQYNQADMQNTAGNRLRGEGYVPSAILTQEELTRRLAGNGYQSQWQPRTYQQANRSGYNGIGGQGGGISSSGSSKGEFEIKPTWFEQNDPDAVKANPMLGMSIGFDYPRQAPQQTRFGALPIQIPYSLEQRHGPNDFSYQAY